MSSYSSKTLSSYWCHVEGPCLEVVAIVFFFPWGLIIRKTNFPILEMSLLHCFTITREMAVSSATFSIIYNLFPKVTITVRGLDSYTTCCFYKYGWPNNTSQTSRGAMSHNTSSVKGLMLYGMCAASWHENLILSEATQWCTVVGLLWSVSPIASWPLVKWGYFGSHSQ